MLYNRALSLMARARLQPIWRLLYRISAGGMGYMNAQSSLNGEDRFLADWARLRAERAGPIPVIFDIGANKGDFAASVLRNLARVEVHCFEPNPVTAKVLRERFRDDQRVIVNEVGVGEVSGTLPLYDYVGGQGSEHASFVSETFTDLYVSEFDAVEVPLVAIDEYMSQKNVSYVDLAKIDVEGFERDVLVGMKAAVELAKIGMVQFEFNGHHAFTGLTLWEIGQLLPKYDVYRILPDGTVKVLGSGSDYKPGFEMYRYSNYVAVGPELGRSRADNDK